MITDNDTDLLSFVSNIRLDKIYYTYSILSRIVQNHFLNAWICLFSSSTT